MKKILFAPILLLALACAEGKKTPSNQDQTAQENPTTKTIVVEGEVQNIIPGKDGYTAEIKDDAGVIYFVTASRSNLNDPTQYKTVEKGNVIKVSGDSWQMDGKNQITVRQIL